MITPQAKRKNTPKSNPSLSSKRYFGPTIRSSLSLPTTSLPWNISRFRFQPFIVYLWPLSSETPNLVPNCGVGINVPTVLPEGLFTMNPRFKKAKFKIKIDHHPEVEKYGKIQVVKTNACAAAEIITDILLSFKGNYVLSKEAASYLYSGIAGDSGRFQYSSTSEASFITASYLLAAGIELSDVYNRMYQKKIDDLKVTAYILNHFSVSEHGVAYYVLDDAIQKELNITTERGKENVNLFSNIEGINAWCSVTEDVKDHCWRVSIRSRSTPINGVAAKWEGGGHAQASGAKVNNLDLLPEFIDDLDKLFR